MGGLHKNKPPARHFIVAQQPLNFGQTAVDLAEHISDNGSQDHERSDNNDGNQYKNQRIFNETLSLLFR